MRKNQYGQLAKQAKSREKMIARLEEELVDTIADVRGPTMKFGAAARSGDIVLAANDLGKSFAAPLFAGVSLEITRGERHSCAASR